MKAHFINGLSKNQKIYIKVSSPETLDTIICLVQVLTPYHLNLVKELLEDEIVEGKADSLLDIVLGFGTILETNQIMREEVDLSTIKAEDDILAVGMVEEKTKFALHF